MKQRRLKKWSDVIESWQRKEESTCYQSFTRISPVWYQELSGNRFRLMTECKKCNRRVGTSW